mmetsp:Transcript_8509/g.31475  ORF Transcript_8509/g.31475 Transcript_8509/m.31475 type:complete len:613 (-) Transcript_8509:847-2685(-)
MSCHHQVGLRDHHSPPMMFSLFTLSLLLLFSLILATSSTTIQISTHGYSNIQMEKNISKELRHLLVSEFVEKNAVHPSRIRASSEQTLSRISALEQENRLKLNSENEMDAIEELIQKQGNKKLEQEWKDLRDVFTASVAAKHQWTRNLRGSSEARNETAPEFVYHNQEDLTYLLHKWAEMHPNLMRVASAGKSWQGRDLWYVILSGKRRDSVHLKPAFRYVANIHGDEVVGREMLVHFVHHLLTNYCCVECGDSVCSGTDQQRRITKLLDSVDMILMPTMNPDGYHQGRRQNWRGQDLNRNFPDQYRDPVDIQSGREVEVQHVMKFTRAYPVVLTANLHGGALVANYPYDGTPDGSSSPNACPDDALYRQLALAYSRAHRKMHLSSEFRNGITQGSAWYSLYGGLQDWVENNVGGWALTMELSDIKTPPESTLSGFWDDNQDALLTYAEQIYQGVYGVVMDNFGSFPLRATVKVDGIDKEITAFASGDFYRLLTPGTYTLTVSADDYVSKSIEVQVKEGEPTFVEIELDRKSRDSEDDSNIIVAGYSSRLMVGILTFLFMILAALTLVFLLGRGFIGGIIEKQLGSTHMPHGAIDFPMGMEDSDNDQHELEV